MWISSLLAAGGLAPLLLAPNSLARMDAAPRELSSADGALRAVRITSETLHSGTEPTREVQVQVQVQVDIDASIPLVGLALELPGLVVPRFNDSRSLERAEHGLDGSTWVELQDEDGDGLLTWTVNTQRDAPLPLDAGELRVQLYAEVGGGSFVLPLPAFAVAAPPLPTFASPAEGAEVAAGARLVLTPDGYDDEQFLSLETLLGPVRELAPEPDEDGRIGYPAPPALFGAVIATASRSREDSFEREGVLVERLERAAVQRRFQIGGSQLDALLERPEDVGFVERGVTSFDVWTLDPLGQTFAHHATVATPSGALIHVLGTSEATLDEVHRLREMLAFVVRRTAASELALGRQADALAARKTCFVIGYEQSFEAAVQQALDLGLDPVWMPAEHAFVEGSDADLQSLGVDAMLEVVLRALIDEALRATGPAHDTLRAAFERARTAGLWRGDAPRDEQSASSVGAASYIVALAQAAFGQWGAFAAEDGRVDGAPLPCSDRASLERIDPAGAALVRDLLGERFDGLTLIDPSFDGRYYLTRRSDLGYTHRSQYIDRARLSGWSESGLVGNDHDNELGGNPGNNTLIGGGGRDVALFAGEMSEYSIERADGAVRVTDRFEGRDGQDLCFGIEVLRFADGELAVADLPR
ncbi:MAG: hypothetical protein R3F49_10090 [Planctomycetota bacterium]